MSERQDFAELLVQHLSWIDRAAAALCRRHGLDADETKDFASWAKERLMENDYAILRKFRGDSALKTYLTVVLSRLYRDYRVARWGRWRPSAEARRRGPVAVRLETLVYRDGYTLEQAIAELRSRGETTLPDWELFVLFGALPTLPRGRPVTAGDAPLATQPGRENADDGVARAEAERERAAVTQALNQAMEGLGDEDQLILRLHFWEGLSVAAISRALDTDQKPLYRRIERCMKRLQIALEAEGVSRERVFALVYPDTE